MPIQMIAFIFDHLGAACSKRSKGFIFEIGGRHQAARLVPFRRNATLRARPAEDCDRAGSL